MPRLLLAGGFIVRTAPETVPSAHHCVSCSRSPRKLAPVSGSPAQGLPMLSFSHVSIAGKASAAQSENKAVTLTVEGVTVRGQEAIRYVL